jgi:hypothetical protein
LSFQIREKKLIQREFYNRPAVDWARQNLPQPVAIRLKFASRWARLLVYSLLFSIPVLIIAGLIARKIHEGENLSWWGVFLCGGVLLVPGIVIVLLGALTRQKLVKSLDDAGVKSSMGKRFLWGNLYYVDHVSKITRVGGVTRKIKDNQLELVFADGKAIIPPLIYDRERIWNLINSMPVQVRDDGEIRQTTTTGNSPASGAENLSFDEIVKAMQELKAEHDRNK